MAGTSGGDWRITGEERSKHDAQFFQLKPVNGFVTGEQAKGFFMQSGLPTPVLGQIWTLADMNNDGKMDRKEFSIAMHLIKKKLQGFELPKQLPASLKADPSPMVGSFGTMPAGSAMMPMGGVPPMAGMAPMAGPQPMGMGMPMMSGMAPTAMASSSLAMPIMSNGLAPAMSQTRFMGPGAPGMGMPGSIADKPRTGSFTAQAPLPATSGGSFAMPHPSKLKYTQMFNVNDRNKKGSLTGVEARALLVHTGLPQNILAQIWTLSDIDKDGKLTCDEFCIAMHLSDLAKMGQPLPTVLPPELIPGKARSGSFGNVSQPPQPVAPSQKADSFGDLLGNMGMPPPQPPIPATNGETPQEEEKPAFTFEDKRKENFDKGQAELERRRQALADQMKRENEARLEKERQEQEKRERYRQEQERRRLQEMEKQLEKQRQIEREKEEQRQKMMEQREAARKELDRQRQMEWERQRKDQLLAEKAREYEQLAAVKLRASNLKCEIESLEGKKTEIGQKIEQVRKGVTDFTSSIESMRGTRDAKINDIDKLQKESKELGYRLTQVQAERESLNYRVQTTAQSNPLSEPHRTVLHGVELKKTSIQKLKKELESIERETENKLVEIDDSNVELASLKSRLTDLQQEMTSYQQKQADKTRQHQEELQSKAKQEKEKQEKLRKELEAQRLREEEERKKKEQAKPVQEDSWIAFANDKPATTASDDIWSAAFSSVSSDPNQTSDTGIWGNAFSSQTTAPSASVSSMSSKQGSKFKAIYPFEARNPDELTLDPGDMVWVPDDQTGAEPGWMGGEVDGRKGWFPKDYVEKLPNSQQHEQSSQNFAIENAFSSGAMTSGSGSGTGQLGTTEESLFTGSMAVSPTPGQGQTAPEGLQAQALYPWKAKKDNHLSFNKGDLIMVKEQQEMWWSGELNGQTGWFPKSYVKLVSGPAATPSLQDFRSGTPQSTSAAPMAGGSARATPIVQEPTPEAENYVAMFNYSSSEPGDLTFNQGELIVVTKKDGDWWTGSLNGKTGIFPANYVKLTDQTFPSGVQQVTTDISTETKTQDHNITNSPPSTLNIPSHPLPQQPKTESVESSTNTKSSFGDDLFANFEANIEPLSMETKPRPMDDSINLAPKVDANIPLSNDMFTSNQGEGDFGSAFSDDPFASESPFTPNFSFSTRESQTPASVNNPSLVENKTLLDKVIKDQVVSPIVTPNESYQELSMYFPDSQVKENPFKENQKSESAKDNKNVHMEVASTTGTPSSEIKVEPSVGVIAPDKEAKLAPMVEICTAQSQDPNKAMDPFANFDNAVNAGTSASDSDAFSLDPFADFETQLDTGFENTADNNTKGSQSFSQNMFPAFENPSAAESVGDTKVETDKNTEKSGSDGVQTEKKTDLVTAEFNFNTDPFADFANFSDFSKTNAVNTNESSTQASGVSFEIKQDTSFADFANLSDFSKTNTENTSEPSPQTSGDSLEIKQNLSTDNSTDPFADFSNFTNSQTDSKAARSGLPNEVTSSSDSQQKTVEIPVSDTVAHTSTTEKGDSELSDNFDFIQNLSKAKPSLQNGDSKDESQLGDNFSFIQSLSKSDASTNKVVPEPISASSESISHDSLPSQNPNVMLSDMDITSASPSLQQEPSSKPQTPQPAPVTQQPPAAQSLAPQQPQQQQQKAGSSSTLKKPEIASVIAAYTATGPEQLSLQPGQILQVRKKSPSGWWEGELQARGQKKKIGWFPANYVKLLGSSARSTPDTSSQSGSPANTLNRTATPTIPPPQPQATAVTENKYIDQVIALYPYTAQHDDELTFHKDSVINILKKDDDSWWQGELNGVVGLFPSNYVGPLTQSPPQENTWSTDPAVLAQTSSTESKRQNYIHELINTEETYMSDMSIVLDAFYKPMSDAKVMTEEELSSVFVNWKELIVCNTKLLKSLRVRKKMCGKGQVINVLGDILCENFPHMGAYIRFCSCQLNAAALIQRKTENSQEFRELQKKCVQDPRTKGMPMSSFLLKPMQRITKYPLMLQKILQYTPEGHPDRQNLQDALAEAEKLCNQVNEGVRERENCDKLEWIQQAVQCEGLPEKIIFNSLTNCLGPRKIIYSGTLYKVKSNKELVGFLFNDFLLLTSPLTNSTSLFIMDPKSKAKYRMYKQPIFLNEVAVKKVEDDSDPFMFHIAHIDRVYNLKCPNQTERDAWVRHIEASAKIYNDTEKKKREKAYNSVTKPKGVGRLLVIILEGINLAPSADVKKIPGVGRLLVVIVEGRDLQPSDANGKSDPYCEVSMGAQEHKTPVINSTLNPKWNKSMQFTIKDVEQDVLCITVYDRDLFSPNDFLGRTEVRVSELLGSEKRGPVTKSLLLHEVSQGEVVVKLDLQLYEDV